MRITEIAIGICLLGVAICIKVYISHELEFRRNKKLVENRKLVADRETMEKHTWKALDIADDDTSQQDLAGKFRSTLKPQDQ